MSEPALCFVLVTFALVAGGCAEPATTGPGCLQSEPDALGAPCNGDGECGSWLTCDAAECIVPPTVSGTGGVELSIVDAGEVAETIRVEVARSDVARRRGLSHRPCMQDGWGLLIEFPQPAEHLIETSDMRFDLDIAMTGSDGVIHTVHRGAPAGGKALYGAADLVQKVLEVRAGDIVLSSGQTLRTTR